MYSLNWQPSLTRADISILPFFHISTNPGLFLLVHTAYGRKSRLRSLVSGFDNLQQPARTVACRIPPGDVRLHLRIDDNFAVFHEHAELTRKLRRPRCTDRKEYARSIRRRPVRKYNARNTPISLNAGNALRIDRNLRRNTGGRLSPVCEELHLRRVR